MMESLALTRLLNASLGAPVAAALHAVGVQASPANVISDAFALELLVTVCLIAFFVLVRLRLSVEKPGALQHVAEMVHEFTGGQAEQVIGHGYERFQTFTTCIFYFVLLNNLIGLIPGLDTPTASPVVPLGIATLTFLYYNFHGLRVQGAFGYLKHFCGPVWWLIWLMLPVEIVSHLARIMSLTIRLYANMLASDLLTLSCFSIFPFAAPSIFLALHFLVSIIQSYVFMLLAMIYLSMAVAHEN